MLARIAKKVLPQMPPLRYSAKSGPTNHVKLTFSFFFFYSMLLFF